MKKLNLNWFFIFTVFYLEAMTHFFCFNGFKIVNSLFFISAFGLILGGISQISKKEIVNKIIFYLLLISITIIFISQTVYFKIYDSFFSVTSIGMAGAIVEGADQIFSNVLDNILSLFLLTFPLIFGIVLKKFLNFEKINKLKNKFLISFIIIYHACGLIYVNFFNLDANGTFSNYEIYNHVASPIISVDRFGVITSMRLEAQKKFLNAKEVEILAPTTLPPSEIENKEVEYNDTDIPWDTIINNESDKNIKQVHQYLSVQQPTNKNEYTGIFEGKNVIFLLGESLYKPILSEELTPTLYKMMNEGFNFENYYVPLYPTSTADGEYMLEWSLIPIIGNSYNLKNSAKNLNPYGLVDAFKNLNYKTFAYHDYQSYFYGRDQYFKYQGYDEYGFCDTSLKMNCPSFHASDLTMFQKTINNFINEDHFLVNYVLVSPHGGYDYKTNPIVRKNWNLVKDLDYSDYAKGYIAGVLETEKALTYLVDELDKAGKLDDTVFVLSPDHYPYYFKTKMNQLEEIAGNAIYDKFELHRNGLIIYNSAMKEPVKVSKTTASIDVLPTLLNLMGVEYDSRLLMGTDALSDNDSIVIFSDYSWITDLGRFDGKKFIPASEEMKNKEDYTEHINDVVKQKVLVSQLIQKNNYYKHLFDSINDLSSNSDNKEN